MKLIYTLSILLALGLIFNVEGQKPEPKSKGKASGRRHRGRGWNGGYPQTTNAPQTSSAPVTQPPTTLPPTTLPPTTLPPTTLPPTTTPVPTSTPTSPIYYTYGDLSYYSSVIAGTYSAAGTFLEHSEPRTGSVTFAVDYVRQIWYYGRQYTDGNVTDEWYNSHGYYTNNNGKCAYNAHPTWTEVLQQINGQQLLYTDLTGDRVYSGYDPSFFGGISGVLRVLPNGRIASENWSFLTDADELSTFLNMYTSHSTTIPDRVYNICKV